MSKECKTCKNSLNGEKRSNYTICKNCIDWSNYIGIPGPDCKQQEELKPICPVCKKLCSLEVGKALDNKTHQAVSHCCKYPINVSPVGSGHAGGDFFPETSAPPEPCPDCKQQEELKPGKYKLLKCPLCGNIDNVDYAIYPPQQNQSYRYFSTRYSVRCYWNGTGNGCGAESGHFKSKSEAREAWNTRHNAGKE